MLALARPVDDTTHHRHLEAFHARVFRFPNRHLSAQIVVNRLGHFLESGAGRTTTPWTGGNARHKTAHAQGLQNFSGNDHLLGARLTGFGGERDTNGVANALLQKNGQSGSRGHGATHTHTRLGQT